MNVLDSGIVSNMWDMEGQGLLQRGKAGTIEHIHHVLGSELAGVAYRANKLGANAERLMFTIFTHFAKWCGKHRFTAPMLVY